MGSFVFSDYELSVAVLGRRKRTRALRTPPRGTGRTSLSTEALASTRGGGSMVISRAETPGPSHQHMAAAPTTDRSSAPFLFAGCAYGSCSTNKTVPNGSLKHRSTTLLTYICSKALSHVFLIRIFLALLWSGRRRSVWTEKSISSKKKQQSKVFLFFIFITHFSSTLSRFYFCCEGDSTARFALAVFDSGLSLTG
jgi:hypothetical protein